MSELTARPPSCYGSRAARAQRRDGGPEEKSYRPGGNAGQHLSGLHEAL